MRGPSTSNRVSRLPGRYVPGFFTISVRDRPDIVVADEIASRAGAFALAKQVRDDTDPYTGLIVILLERKHDAWLARWSGADAWFVKPVDPFELADRLLELVSEKESA